MSNNDWTNKLRDSLADYQEPVKADLWASIEQSLAQQGILPGDVEAASKKNAGAEPANAARLMTIKKWSAVAATVALLAVGGSYVYLHQDGSAGIKPHSSFAENKSFNHASAESKLHNASVENEVHSSADLQSAANKSAHLLAQNSTAVSKSASLLAQNSTYSSVCNHHFGEASGSYNLVAEAESSADLQSAASSDSNKLVVESASSDGNKLVAESASPVNLDPQQQVARNESQQQVARNKNLKQDDALFGVDFASDLKHQTDWNVQFYAENGLITTSSINQGNPVLSSGTYYDSAIPGSFITNTAAPYASFLKSVSMKKPKHHAPLSVGVQVGIPLVSRLSLSTGVVYTRAISDFAVYSNQDFDTHQVLHYVGVPVGVNYEVWGTRRFHTYVMAGGEVDFNVKNSTTRNDEPVDDVKRDRPQISAKASVGAQLDVSPQIGVYVEPGAKYYFDNGSSIDNTFKDKKLNFNFQFGLRWNIGK